ncbi:pyruvate formate-lyase [Clostridiaceae bacterium NSJ-31]|uniref:Pyruvate formate-lyase n=3 Tax=Ligaoa zhengdingensis TaxID=2763658 RepID=A0A926I5K5_9FIRM|nr:pyruvate formate lyase family protein [Ligaoa zhengdingensis]MBC8547565.1 pyruvate formate-lyase [Ligaoa zhengdingensis]
MTDRIQAMRQFFITDRKHHAVRRPPADPMELARRFERENTPDYDRAAIRLCHMLEQEKPVLFEDERIAFTRTISTVPEIYTEEELTALKKEHWIHELGDVSNINVDYTKLLGCGFDAKREELRGYLREYEKQGDERAVHVLQTQISILDTVQNLADRYRQLALEQGNRVVAESLAQVPAKPPRSFLEALQMFRIIHFTMWCGRNYHNTVGRFDQYMLPYLKADLEKGIYDLDSALELLEEFFLTFNRDSDLYPGMQQGDNGQSIVLGGLNEDGTDSYNILSELCLKASLELKLIDPKINLRVHKNTPVETYVLGTQLTKQGLGFPQYSNDDVVIPGLLNLGYEKKDAYNYAVAACWEFIIPGVAMDVPNIEALSFTKAVENAVFEHLEDAESYDAFREIVRRNIFSQAADLCGSVRNLYVYPAPFLSLMMEGCAEKARDISLGCKYNNYGLHGTGIATAADSLAAIKKYVFEEQSVGKQEMIDALKGDFAGHDLLCNKLRYETPKMGNNVDYVDEIAAGLLADFADSVQGRTNDRGGIFRAGTGSAMYYIWHSKDMPATPDGRHKGEGIAANYSPSLFSRCKGPVSIIKSFSKPDLKRVINGGPLTLELHDTVFRTEDSIQKVALLVKSFMDLGGHQLQLNSVNRDTMLDAQKHPENYRNLIVRVWGWSGYFVELDREYQDHIIQRMELVV